MNQGKNEGTKDGLGGLGKARWVDGSGVNGWNCRDKAGAVGRTRRGNLERGKAEAGNLGVNFLPICLPALQVAEIQKIELSVILSMVDGVHILGEVEVAHICFRPLLGPLPLGPTYFRPSPCPTHPLHLLTAMQSVVITQGSVGLREATCRAGDGLAPGW